MEPYLYYGIRDYDLDSIISILRRGFIVPRKMLGEKYKTERTGKLDLTGDSWIDLCQKSLYDDSYGDISPSKFDIQILNHMCAVLEHPLEGIQYPTHLIYDICGPEEVQSKIKDDSTERYSVFLDEVQTNVPVPTSKFTAIGYPRDFLLSESKEYGPVKTTEQVKEELEALRQALVEGNLTIPIVDSSYWDFADDKERIRRYTIR